MTDGKIPALYSLMKQRKKAQKEQKKANKEVNTNNGW